MATTLWGYTQAVDASNSQTNGNIIAGVGTFGAISNAYVTELAFYNIQTTSRATRMAVYQGGTSDTNPFGATLITELAITGGGIGWVTGTVTGAPALAANTRTWVVCKNSVGLPYTNSYTNKGDFNATNGRVVVIGATNTPDQTLPFPVTMDNTSTTTVSWGVHLRMGYDVSGGGGSAIAAISSGFHVRNINR